MPKYSGQLIFITAKLRKAFYGQKKSHYISLYLSIPLPLPQHSTKEPLFVRNSNVIFWKSIEKPRSNSQADRTQISSHICWNGNLFSQCGAEINFSFNICRVFPLREALLDLNVEKAPVQDSNECRMLSFTLGNLVLALMTPSVNGMQ